MSDRNDATEIGPKVVAVKSTTEKTYTVTIEGAGARAWPYSVARIYRPARLTVLKRDGNVARVELGGPQIKKDDGDGTQWATEVFYGAKDRPDWLNPIIGGLA